MKNKILMLVAIAAIAIGVTGCSVGKSRPLSSLAETGQTKYVDYSAEKMTNLRGKQKFAAFFHAEWCGTCRAWQKNIIEISSELPADAVILRINYDNAPELVKEFNIKSQSTAVFFDAEGNITETVMDPSMDKVKSFFAKNIEKDMEMKKEEATEKDSMETTTMGDEIEEMPAQYMDYSKNSRDSLAEKSI